MWARFARDRAALVGLAIIIIFTVAAAAAHWIAPYDPTEQFFDGLTLEGAPLPPSSRFWFGSDTNGRDQFSRLLYGAQTSLLIGVLANGLAVALGTLLGVTAGFLRGLTGAAIMRLTDLMMAFPPLLLAIALAAILKPGIGIVIIVIALVNWVQIARVIYAETTGLVNREYIEAARAMGAGPWRILWRHLLPHLVPTVIVYATLGIATTVLLEAMLSFLGRGVQPPTPAWGMMIFESQSYFLNAPWLVFVPGAAILILALAFNLVGDGLRDALDPTQRGRT
jgi:peptide/nickel transport system permease protein